MTASVVRPHAAVRRALAGAALAVAALVPGLAARAADAAHPAASLSPKARQVLQTLVLADALDYLAGRRSTLARYYHRPRPLPMTTEQAAGLVATDGARLEALTAGQDVLLVGTVVRVVPSAFSNGWLVEMRGGAAELEDDRFGAAYARQLSPGQRIELLCHGASSRAQTYGFHHCAPVRNAASSMDDAAIDELLAGAAYDPAAARLVADAQLAADHLPADSFCYAASDPAPCLRQIANLERHAPARDAGLHAAPKAPAVAEADVFRSPAPIDCGAPASSGQRIVCADLDLSAREVALRQLFDTVQLAAYARSVEASKALVAAHAASSAERDACADRACVSAWFDSREAQLAAIAAGAR